MGRHGALGEPRRAAGVEDAGEIVAPLILDGQRPAVRERDPGLDEVPGAGVLHHVGHLFQGETEVHRHDDRAREHDPPERQGPVGAVRQAKGNPVAGLHPGLPQAARHPGRPVPQLGVGHPVPAHLHQRLAGRVPVDRPAQGLHEVLGKRAVPSGTVGATLDVACVEGVVHQPHSFPDVVQDRARARVRAVAGRRRRWLDHPARGSTATSPATSLLFLHRARPGTSDDATRSVSRPLASSGSPTTGPARWSRPRLYHVRQLVRHQMDPLRCTGPVAPGVECDCRPCRRWPRSFPQTASPGCRCGSGPG